MSGGSPINFNQQHVHMYNGQVPLNKQLNFMSNQNSYTIPPQLAPTRTPMFNNMLFTQQQPPISDINTMQQATVQNTGSVAHTSGSNQPSTVTSPFTVSMATPGTQAYQPSSVYPAGSSLAPTSNSVPPYSVGQRNTPGSLLLNGGNIGTVHPSKSVHMPPNLVSYPVRKYRSNMAILRLYEIINWINISTGKLSNYNYWNKFALDMFAPYGVLRYTKKNGDNTRQFEFTLPIIPSVFKSLGTMGVVRIEMVPQQLRAQVLSNGTIFFEFPRSSITLFFSDGSYITHFTQIKGIFDSSLKIEWCDISTYNFVPGIEWNSIEKVISNQAFSHEIFQKLSNSSVNGSSTSPSYGEELPSNISAITHLRSQFKVFQHMSSIGIHESFMRVLQVNDVMSYLKNLKVYQKFTGIKSPLHALNSFIASNQDGSGVSMASPNNGPNPTTTSMNIGADHGLNSANTIIQSKSTEKKKHIPKKRKSTDSHSIKIDNENEPNSTDYMMNEASFKKMKF